VTYGEEWIAANLEGILTKWWEDNPALRGHPVSTSFSGPSLHSKWRGGEAPPF